MNRYAVLNDEGKVINVIIAEGEFIEQMDEKAHAKHKEVPIKNKVSRGMEWDEELGLFKGESPYLSWVLDLETGEWKSAKEKPADMVKPKWDEATNSWIEKNKEDKKKDMDEGYVEDRNEHRIKLMVMNAFNNSEEIIDAYELDEFLRDETGTKKISRKVPDKARTKNILTFKIDPIITEAPSRGKTSKENK